MDNIWLVANLLVDFGLALSERKRLDKVVTKQPPALTGPRCVLRAPGLRASAARCMVTPAEGIPLQTQTTPASRSPLAEVSRSGRLHSELHHWPCTCATADEQKFW
jgi:hypothetical protein